MDADRIASLHVPVTQLNTDPSFGGECHLDANMVRSAIPSLPLDEIDLLVIENVGNLVCPAEFRVGEDARVMVASVAEGEDKPLKYPLMFRTCELVLINKIDLLPHLDFDLDRFLYNLDAIHPDVERMQVSARTGEGSMSGATGWRACRSEHVPPPSSPDRPRPSAATPRDRPRRPARRDRRDGDDRDARLHGRLRDRRADAPGGDLQAARARPDPQGPAQRRRAAIELAHWGYGAAGGAAFAALPEALRRRAWAGPIYGFATWLGFELALAPALGLSQATKPRPLERPALAVDHLLYGFVLSETRRRPQA